MREGSTVRTPADQLRYYLEGFAERAQAAIDGTPLHPETELAAAVQALGAWEAAFDRLPTYHDPMCPGCED